jgi:signal peptidase I
MRGTWRQALGHLALSVLLILSIRWAFFEPYVIPSGSMIPTLLIHDHIFVNKFVYGLRLPFSMHWVWRWSEPRVGDVVVFRSLADNDIYLIKRVVAIGGETIEVSARGEITRLGKKVSSLPLSADEEIEFFGLWPKENLKELDSFKVSLEVLEERKHLKMTSVDASSDVVVQTPTAISPAGKKTVVPPAHFFAMGDNRDRSSDSRVFGAVPVDRILGRAAVIWLSCDATLAESPNVCDPLQLRAWRLFKSIL